MRLRIVTSAWRVISEVANKRASSAYRISIFRVEACDVAVLSSTWSNRDLVLLLVVEVDAELQLQLEIFKFSSCGVDDCGVEYLEEGRR